MVSTRSAGCALLNSMTISSSANFRSAAAAMVIFSPACALCMAKPNSSRTDTANVTSDLNFISISLCIDCQNDMRSFDQGTGFYTHLESHRFDTVVGHNRRNALATRQFDDDF